MAGTRRLIGGVLGGILLGATALFAGPGTQAPEPPKTPPPAEGAPAAPQGPHPKIKFEATELNLGDVVRGKDAVGTFTYKNSGDVTLHILSAKPGCSCTVTSFDAEVEPGATGTIKASIKTANFSGAIGKGVSVTTDDPDQPQIMLSIKANVVGSIAVLPYPSLSLAPRVAGFGKPANLVIRRDETEKGELAISKLTATVPWLKLSARKVTAIEPAVEGLPTAMPGDYVVSVLVEHPPSGSSVQSITFKTGLTREPEVTVPVTVTVRPAVVLQPTELTLQPKPDSPKTASAQMLAAVREDLDPKSLVVASDDPSFTVTTDNSGERAFRLTVAWQAKGAKPVTSTTVHFSVNGESVDLPVRVGKGDPAKREVAKH